MEHGTPDGQVTWAEGGVPAAVTWGLLAAWTLHDAEELATMAGWARRARPKLEERFPRVPAKVWGHMEVSQKHVAVAIGLMGGVMAAASAAGSLSGGRSRFFQTALAGFGAHGAVHLVQSVAYRGYTPGVVTAPVVVIPFSIWAWRRLRAAGILPAGRDSALLGLALLPLTLGAVHTLAHIITRAPVPPPDGVS